MRSCCVSRLIYPTAPAVQKTQIFDLRPQIFKLRDLNGITSLSLTIFVKLSYSIHLHLCWNTYCLVEVFSFLLTHDNPSGPRRALSQRHQFIRAQTRRVLC